MVTGPDPKAARTPADFVATMRQLRTWADLSYRQVERNAIQAGDVLPRATISGALARTDLPREELLAAFVRACGGDATTVATWLTARRELAISTEPAVLADAQDTLRNEATQQPAQDHENTPADTPPPPPAADPAPDTPAPDAQGQQTAPAPALPPDSPSGNHGDSAFPATSPQPAATEPTAQHQTPPAPDQDTTRHRYLPMTLTGAAAAAGVLLLALWPSADKPSTAQPKNQPSTSASPANTASPTTPSPTVSLPLPSTAPVQAGTEKTAEKTTGTPTTRTTTPSTRSPSKTSAPPRALQTGPVRIHPLNDPDLCLTEGRERNGRTDREIAVQSPCGQPSLPTVSLTSAGAQTYHIQWDHPGHGVGCLAVDDASTSPGALLAPHDCADAGNQEYRLEATGDGYRIRPVHSGLCIGILTPRTTGAEAIQQNCTGTDDQTFRITKS